MSVDNLVVFLLLFRLFQIDRAPSAPRPLLGSRRRQSLMRGAFIAGGITLLSRFEFISYNLRRHPPRRRGTPAPSPPAKTEPATTPRWIAQSGVSTRQSPHGPFLVSKTDAQPRPHSPARPRRHEAHRLVLSHSNSIDPLVLSITPPALPRLHLEHHGRHGLRSLYFLLIASLTRLRFLHYGLAAVLPSPPSRCSPRHWFEIGPRRIARRRSLPCC